MSLRLAALLALVTATAWPVAVNAAGDPSDDSDSPLASIKHIVVIYEENHSFDNLYGGWEGVNGRSSAGAAQTIQVDQNGNAYSCLLQNEVNLTVPPLTPDCSPTSHFQNQPFSIEGYIPASATTCPPPGGFYPHGS